MKQIFKRIKFNTSKFKGLKTQPTTSVGESIKMELDGHLLDAFSSAFSVKCIEAVRILRKHLGVLNWSAKCFL